MTISKEIFFRNKNDVNLRVFVFLCFGLGLGLSFSFGLRHGVVRQERGGMQAGAVEVGPGVFPLHFDVVENATAVAGEDVEADAASRVDQRLLRAHAFNREVRPIQNGPDKQLSSLDVVPENSVINLSSKRRRDLSSFLYASLRFAWSVSMNCTCLCSC